MPVVPTTPYPPASEAMELIRSLLADLDVVERAYITPTGAVRAANVSTFTETVAHGFVVGDIVNVQAVDDPTFNGKYPVLTVPTITTFTVENPDVDASSGHGYIDQIGRGDVYTNTVLLNFVKLAYRTVQRELLGEGNKGMTRELVLENFSANATVINDATFPALPTDFLAPREVWERPYLSTVRFKWMQPVNVIPDRPIAPYNCVYAWYDDSLYFVGANQALDLKIRYYSAEPDIFSEDSLILIRGGLDAVVYKGAMLACGSRSSPLLPVWNQEYTVAIERMKDLQEHARQYLPSRRRPYGRGGRINNGNGKAWY